MMKITVVFEPINLEFEDEDVEGKTREEIRQMAIDSATDYGVRPGVQNVFLYKRRIGEAVWTEAHGRGTVIGWEGPDDDPDGYEVEMEDGEVRYFASDEVFGGRRG